MSVQVLDYLKLRTNQSGNIYPWDVMEGMCDVHPLLAVNVQREMFKRPLSGLKIINLRLVGNVHSYSTSL